MSPYYDQPGWRQRGPEDVAGVLVLFACAAVAILLVRCRVAPPSAQRPVP